MNQGNVSNVRFGDFVRLIEAFGFRLDRTRGIHYIYRHDEIPDSVNIQSAGGQAKEYQIRQFLWLVEHYNIELGGRR